MLQNKGKQSNIEKKLWTSVANAYFVTATNVARATGVSLRGWIEMQKATIIHGTVSRQYGKTVSEQINEILEKNSGYQLVQTTVLHSTDVFCTLLCVFEKNEQEDK